MTWVKIDDRAPTHPKIGAAGADAFGLWVCALCFANAHATDGHLPKHSLVPIAAGLWPEKRLAALAKRLVEVGLWEVDDEHGGWRIHDYAEHQEPALKANVEHKRALARARKARQRAREKSQFSDKTNNSPADVTRDRGVTVTRDGPRDRGRDTPRDMPRDEVRDVARDQPCDQVGDREGSVDACHAPPTRPDPARPLPTEERERARAPLPLGRSSLSDLPDPWAEDPAGVGSFAFVWRLFKLAGEEAFGEPRVPRSPRGSEYTKTELVERHALELAVDRSSANGTALAAEFRRVVDVVLQRFVDDVRASKTTPRPKPWKIAFLESGFAGYASGLATKGRAA